MGSSGMGLGSFPIPPLKLSDPPTGSPTIRTIRANAIPLIAGLRLPSCWPVTEEGTATHMLTAEELGVLCVVLHLLRELGSVEISGMGTSAR